MATITRKQFEEQYGSDVLTAKPQGVIKETFGDIVDTGKAVVGSLKGAGEEAVSDFQKSQSGERSPIKAGFDIAGSVVGGISDSFGDIAVGAGKVLLPESAEQKIKSTVETGAEKLFNTESVQSLVNSYGLLPEDRKQDLRTSGEFLEAMLDIVGLKGATMLKQPVKQIAGAGIDVTKKGTKIAKEAVEFIADKAPDAKNLIKPKKKVVDVVGEVLQGKTRDVKQGVKTLSNLDTTNVKTYKDLGDSIQTRIGSLSRGVDDVLSQDKTLTKLAKLTSEAKSTSGKVIKTNYVERALTDFAELYTKIGDGVKAQDITDIVSKAKKTGLTKLEVNNLAREYGQEFGSKAFSKLGEPLTSVNAKLFENTRKGLKDIARKGIGSTEAKEIDSVISSMFSTQKLVKKNIEAVNKLQQKISDRGLLEKLGYTVSKTADIATGGTIRGVVGGILPRGVGNKVFNALDLEKRLKENLKIINKALTGKTDDEIVSVLKAGVSKKKSLIQKIKDTPNKEGGFAKNPLTRQSSKVNESVSLPNNTTKSLTEQAKKYKSAEEFVKATNKELPNKKRLYRGMTQKFDKKFDLKSTDAPSGYSTWTDSRELAVEYAGKKGFVYQADLPKSERGLELINNDGDRVLFLNNEKKAGLNGVSGDEYLLYNDHELYNPELIKDSLSKSQLTDIWKKANKK